MSHPDRGGSFLLRSNKVPVGESPQGSYINNQGDRKMKKLKVIKPFYDKKEAKYVYPEKQPTIDREDKRAAQLIAAGVAEEYAEAAEQADATPAEEKPPKKGGKK